MQPQIVYDDFWQVEDEDGITFLPVDLIGENPEPVDFSDHLESGKPAEHYRVIEGYGARLSAPGYMDCTPWTVFATKQEAVDYLKETYDVED